MAPGGREVIAINAGTEQIFSMSSNNVVKPLSVSTLMFPSFKMTDIQSIASA